METKRDSFSAAHVTLENRINALFRLCRICLNKTGEHFISMNSKYTWSDTEIQTTESMIEHLLPVKVNDF